MKIKTFQTPTMQEAIQAIKQELGPDAVILSTKHIRTGGVLGMFGKTMVEVTAATDLAPVPPTRGKPHSLPSTNRLSTSRGGQHPAETLTFNLRIREPDCKPDLKQDPQDVGEGRAGKPLDGPADWPAWQKEWQALKAELRMLRRLVESAYREARAEAGVGLDSLPDGLLAWYETFIRQGLKPQTAHELLHAVAQRLTPTELDSETVVRQALHRELVRRIKVSGPLLDVSDWKKTVILIGPTGVGKTTTIAKLAAHYKLNEKRQVSLITLDTYRVAAVEQLRLYAKLLGITMDVALTRREALDCIRKRTRSELILIDTAGRSPRDEAGIAELRQLLALDHPLETHLVLAATTREQELTDWLARYEGLPLHRLLFTKLDEATSYGHLFELMVQTGLPLSYVSVGQNVPEDLELAQADRLAELVLGGDLRSSGERPSVSP
jgi:flagellar biosynthesis protein FlhF